MSGAPRGTVLLVEDNATIRGAFGVLLEESGYRVGHAASGSEAIEAARRDLPDLVLMDLGLPDIGGLEVTRRLKVDPQTRGIPVVAITGRTLAADQRACTDAGCAAYLSKPVNSRVLLAMVEEQLRVARRG